MSQIFRGQAPRVLTVAFLSAGLVFQIPNFLPGPLEEKSAAFRQVVIIGMFLAGLICWSWGRALRRRDGWSHTVYRIPVQWIGLLILGGSAIYLAQGEWEKAHPKPAEAVATTTTPVSPTPSLAPMERPLTASPWKRRDTAAERLAMADAVKAYPELGDLNSAFHTRWKALSAEYRNTRPDFFESPSWPLALARETDKLLKSKAP